VNEYGNQRNNCAVSVQGNAAAPAPQANSAPLRQVAGRRTASVARLPLTNGHLPRGLLT
jgi:hypothetical protein